MHTLTHFRLCPFSRQVRLALAESGIPVTLAEERPWDARPQFLALNPAGELPILALHDGPMLCGAYAISEYLAALPPLNEDRARSITLFPGPPDEQAEIRRLTDWSNRKLDREVTRELLIEKVYARLAAASEHHAPDANILRAVRSNLRYHLKYLDFLANQRKWLAGDTASFADLAASAHLSTIDYLNEIPWDEFPSARLWYARLKSRPSFRPLLSDRQPGHPPPAHYDDLDW